MSFNLTRHHLMQSILRPAVTRWARQPLSHRLALSTSACAHLQPRTGGPRVSRSARPDRAEPRRARPDHSTRRSEDPFAGSNPVGGPSGFRESPFAAEAGSGAGYGQDPASMPVHIPSDPNGVLKDTHGAVQLLANSALVVVRQLEMLNVFMGFEQANRYAIMSPEGKHVGYMAEEGQTLASTMMRQALRTHRPFRSVVMDKHGTPVLWIRRPFAFINSRIYVHAEQYEGNQEQDKSLVGEAQQRWHPWRRRYDLFKHQEDTFKQFAAIDSGFWAWDFWLKDRDDRITASINRNFAGFGRELFTDTGQYVVRFDAVEQELAISPPSATPNAPRSSIILPPTGGLTLDERAMTLATAVTIDIDYFSRHSGGGGMGFPFFMWGGGVGDELGRTGGAGMGGAVGGAAGGMMGGMADGERGQGETVEDGENVDGNIYGAPSEGFRGYPDSPFGGAESGYSEEVWGEQLGQGGGEEVWGEDFGDGDWS